MSAIKFIQQVARMKAADFSKIGEGIVTMADRLNFEHIAGEIAATFQNAGLTPDKWDDVIKSKDDVIKYLNIIESSKPTVSKVSNDIIKKGSESAEVIDFKGWNPNVIEGGKKEGVESLFEETTKVAKEPKYGKLDYDRIAKQEGVDVEEIRGKSFREIMEYLSAVRDKADGGRIGYGIGGQVYYSGPAANSGYDSRASVQDFQNALRSVGAGTTYQQQADALRYAKNKASEMLSQAFKSGNQGTLQSILQGIGGIGSMGGMQFTRSGNRITGAPATGSGRDAIINAMAHRMMSYPIQGSSAPPKKSPLQLKIEKNKRIYDEYVKNNPGLPTAMSQTITGPKGGTPPSPGLPPYEQQALLDQLTMLTPEEAFAGETFDTLSDLDQYNFAQAFTQYQPQLRNPNYVSPQGVPGAREIFARRYGIKDGGRIGFNTGGWADDLTGQAAAIYQSMNLGGHSDATIQNTLRSLGYWDGDTSGGSEGIENIINTQQSIIPGAGGEDRPTGPESYTQTWTSEGIMPAAQSTSFINDPESVNALNQKIYDYMGTQMGPFSNDPLRSAYEKYSQEDFMAQNPEYFSQGNVQPERTGLMGMWDKTKDFFSGLKGSPKVRGQLGTRLANQPRLPLPASIASWSMSPFNQMSRNYNPNFEAQLNFLEGQDGMIGRDPNTGLLKYGPDSVLAGKNVISMFGTNDYEEALQNKIDWFENRIAKGKKISWTNYQKALAEQKKAGILALKRKEAENKKKKLDEVAKITGTTQTTGGDGPGSWGGHGSVEAYDKSQKATYERAVDRHRGSSNTTGAVSTGKGNNPWGRKDGGPVGLATMFTRRR